jgi:hypothetical protein
MQDAAMYKFAEFADERLAQKAHRAVVKQYGLNESDGDKYWKLKSAIYQKMGGKFTHKTASLWRAGLGALIGGGMGYLTASPYEDRVRRSVGGALGGATLGALSSLASRAILGKQGAQKLHALTTAAPKNVGAARKEYDAWKMLNNNKSRHIENVAATLTAPALGGYYGANMTKSAESFVPPPAVASAAARGLAYREKASPSNKGGLSVSEAHKQGIGSGVQRAVNLKNRDAVSSDTINRMVSFFARHEGNQAVGAENKGTPWNDKGHVAYLLWGGAPGKAWANKIKNQMERGGERSSEKMANAVAYLVSIVPEE